MQSITQFTYRRNVGWLLSEWRIGKDMKQIVADVTWGPTPVFSWWRWGKSRKPFAKHLVWEPRHEGETPEIRTRAPSVRPRPSLPIYISVPEATCGELNKTSDAQSRPGSRKLSIKTWLSDAPSRLGSRTLSQDLTLGSSQSRPGSRTLRQDRLSDALIADLVLGSSQSRSGSRTLSQDLALGDSVKTWLSDAQSRPGSQTLSVKTWFPMYYKLQHFDSWIPYKGKYNVPIHWTWLWRSARQ